MIPDEASASLLRSILDALTAHVALLDGNGRITAVNQRWRDFALSNGLTDKGCGLGCDYLGVCDTAARSGDELGRQAAEGIRSLLQKKSGQFVLEYPCHSPSETRWFVLRATPLADAGGLVVSHENITARKLADQTLQTSQRQLAHLSRVASVGEMASSLAHELNQPLTAIVAYAGACLNSAGQTPPRIVKSLQEISREADRAAQILRRVRRFIHNAPLEKQPHKIGVLIEEALGLLHRDLQDVNVVVKVELEQVLADAVQVQQVLVNLVQNAVDAMVGRAPGGKRLTISVGEADGFVAVSVSDTGRGADTDTMERLFEPFFTTRSGGLGLGLSICRSIIEAHGGRISAAANAPEGMTFRFTLPRA